MGHRNKIKKNREVGGVSRPGPDFVVFLLFFSSSFLRVSLFFPSSSLFTQWWNSAHFDSADLREHIHTPPTHLSILLYFFFFLKIPTFFFIFAYSICKNCYLGCWLGANICVVTFSGNARHLKTQMSFWIPRHFDDVYSGKIQDRNGREKWNVPRKTRCCCIDWQTLYFPHPSFDWR